MRQSPGPSTRRSPGPRQFRPQLLMAKHSLCLCPNLVHPGNFQDPGCWVGRCLVSRRVRCDVSDRLSPHTGWQHSQPLCRARLQTDCSQALGALFQRRWPSLPAFLPRSLRLRETVGLLGLWNIGNGGEKVGRPVLVLPAGSVCLHGPQQGTPTPCLLVGT